MTTVVGIASDVAASDRRKEESRLTAAGWIGQGPTLRGFVVGTFDGLITVCRGTDFVSIRYVGRPTGGSFVRAALTRDPRRGCVPRLDAASGDPLPINDWGAIEADAFEPRSPAILGVLGGESGSHGDSRSEQPTVAATVVTMEDPVHAPAGRILRSKRLALTVGTRLGVYEVTAQISEGGMGQVYRATDTRLKRRDSVVDPMPPGA